MKLEKENLENEIIPESEMEISRENQNHSKMEISQESQSQSNQENQLNRKDESKPDVQEQERLIRQTALKVDSLEDLMLNVLLIRLNQLTGTVDALQQTLEKQELLLEEMWAVMKPYEAYLQEQQHLYQERTNLDYGKLENKLLVNVNPSAKKQKRKFSRKQTTEMEDYVKQFLEDLCGRNLSLGQLKMISIAVKSPLVSMEEIRKLAVPGCDDFYMYEKLNFIAEIKKELF